MLLSVDEDRLEEQAFAQLSSVRAAKADQIENELNQFLDNLDTLANSRAAQELPEIIKAFDELTSPVDEESLEIYYRKQFAPRTDSFTEATAVTLVPDGLSSQVAQTLYISNSSNPFSVGNKDKLLDAEDGSDYSALHRKEHPFFSAALENFGAYDIFLIDDVTGNIVYSVFKEIDYGTSLANGPHADSGLAEAWRLSLASNTQSTVDFAPYVPSYDAPAAFSAQGVFDERGNRLGTIAMQAPVDRINAVMTSNEQWEAVGLGESGETYIVAGDTTMRNDSRFLIEDPEGFFSALEDAGFSQETIDNIREFDTTIGLLQVDTEGTREALDGASGEAVFPDYRGVPVLSNYGPLNLGEGLDWVVMSEIDEAEAFAPSNGLRRLSTGVIAVTSISMLGLAWLFSGRIVRPVRKLENETDVIGELSFAAGDHYDTAPLDKIAERKDEIGDLAGAFSRLVGSLEENIGARVAVEGELNVAADIQRSLLPLVFPVPPDIFEFNLHATLVPAKEVGGDFYDHGAVDVNHHFFLVGDVSGKGVPAALFMAATKTLIRSGAMSGEPLDELMTRINAEIQESNSEFMFATVWIGILDVRTGEVVFVNAGHNPPLLRRASGEVEYLHDSNGPFVGPAPGVTYTTGSLTLEPGDRLIVYSDGVTEAMDPTETLFGEDRLMEMKLPGTAMSATKSVVDKVLEWEQGTRSDDVTVLIVDFLRKREEHVLTITVEETEPAEAITSINAKVEKFAEDSGLPGDALSKIQMSLDEIITNVLTHGAATEIGIEIIALVDEVFITIVDNGHPFDPLSIAHPDTTLPLHEREVGGLGIHLVRNTMDNVTYNFRDGRNILGLTLEVD